MQAVRVDGLLVDVSAIHEGEAGVLEELAHSTRPDRLARLRRLAHHPHLPRRIALPAPRGLACHLIIGLRPAGLPHGFLPLACICGWQQPGKRPWMGSNLTWEGA